MIHIKEISLDIPIRGKTSLNQAGLLDNNIGGVIQKQNNKFFVRAIDQLSLCINDGERIAILGRNGSGKSSLLKLIAGIYKPSEGSIYNDNDMATIFNLKVGMHENETGFENIYTRGYLLGMSKIEIDSKVENIIKESGLGDFIHIPISNYSSGMLARLAFSIVTSIEPKTLLIDEFIGAGDNAFMEMAQKKIHALADKSKTLILASHSNSTVEKLCTKGAVLKKGKLLYFGDIKDALTHYKTHG